MRRQRFISSTLVALFVLLILLISDVDAKRGKKMTSRDDINEPIVVIDNATINDDFPGVPYLIETIGRELYSAVNRPKYKFYIYMTIGKLPNEEATIIFLNMICNVVYGLCILLGFIFLPRGYMLIGTILTLFVGPALVLILLGSVVLILAAFALYPVISVLSMWIFFFLTSQIAQVIGRKLGLDHDKDGDVDVLDLLHYASTTEWGEFIGLPKLHDMLNESSMDPFQEIHRRLDEILKQSTNNLTPTGNANLGDGKKDI